MKTKKLTNILKDAKNASNQKTEPYDATGIVKRIENGVAWVHIGGGVDETPVRLTMNAKEGDAVQVRVSGGKAWLTGNATSPPTDDTMAYHATHVAQTAQANARNAGIIAEESQAIAIEASQTVEELSETVITNVVVQYAVGTSPSVAPVSGWSTNSPTWEEGKYIWQRTVTTINGVQIPSNVACIQGAKGSDGTSVTILGSYETLAELEAAHPTGTEGDAYMVSGDLYVWNGTEWENVGQIQGPQGPTGPQGPQGNDGHSPVVTATKSGDTTVVYVDGISIATIQDGQDGDNGQPGADGDDAYTHFAWANSADGSVDFSTSVSANKQYIGVYADHTLADSQRYQDYSWSKIKGEQGPQGDDGTSPTVSKSGDTVTIVDAEGHTVTIKDGANGQSIVGPAGDDAYLHLAWANSADGSVDFSTTVATGKQYMGMYSDHTLADSQRYQDYSWTKVKGEQGVQGPQGATGATGKGISKVQTEYYLSTSTSSATGGSWSETPQVFVSGKYYWTRDHIYYDDNTDGYSTAVYNKGLTQANQEALDLQQYFWYKDGTGAEAGAHVTEIPQSDFETTPSGGNLLMKSNKVALRNALVELASFGANGATIGQIENGKSRSEITANGMRIVRRDSNADTEIANLGYGSGNDGQGGVSDAPYYTLGTRENDTQDYSSASTYNVGDMVTYNGSVYICVERITTPESFTPSHWSSILKGNYSCAEGYGVIAQEVASHAEGGYTRAMGKYSHAEGYYSIASGTYSHAEGNATASETFSHAEGNSYSSGVDAHAEGAASARGYVSHAEGSSDATGRWSHSEGFASLASAECSHAQNEGTVADQTNQTAIGQYNTKNNTNNLFVVGKGSSDSNRSDAFSVDANGNVESAGVLTVSGLPSGLTTEQHSGNTGSISATTDSGSKSITATKSGYYPLGVVGWNFTGTNYMYQNLYYCRISSASNGSATVSYRFRNNSSASYSGTFNVDILWVKI